MKLVMATFPDDPAALADWLEQQLVGLDLGALAAELLAVQGDTPGPTLDALLGDDRAAVLGRGLKALPAGQVRLLLRHPRLLLDLQELVLIEGGAYWETVARPADLTAQVDAGWRELAASLPGKAVPVARPLPWYRRASFASLATAASLLVAFGLWQWWRPGVMQPVATWGWQKPGALPQQLPREAYLNQLADAAQEWFKQRPTDAAGVARRIHQFREGCTTLLLAEHTPLTQADREDLRKRCRNWARQLDQQLAELEEGRDPAAVRAEVDGIVQRLTTLLRDRALQG